MPRPAAYLRKSKDAATKAEHLDRLMRSVREHGHNGDTVVYDDWAKSGDQRKLASRRAWREMCAAIEAGQHDVVFMNDLDRGGRSLEEWLRFIRVAQEHGTRVIAAGTDYSLPENKDRLIFEAWLAERELDAAKRRAAETQKMRSRRGDIKGQPPYGYLFARAGDVDQVSAEQPDPMRVVLVADPDRPIQPILDAMRDSQGNTSEAVRLLNERGVPSRYGKAWSTAALRQVLHRLGAMPPVTRKARRTRSGLRQPSPLAKLVRCHCGQTMTPVDSRSEMYCWTGARDGAARHGKVRTTQRRIYEYLKAEIPRRRIVPIYKAGRDVAAERRALEEELRRTGVAYRAGALTDEEFSAEASRLKQAVDDLATDESAVEWTGFGKPRPEIDWDDPVALGEALRARVRWVELDETMMPVRIDWRVQAAGA